MFSSLRAARLPLLALGTFSVLLAGCGGGTNLPAPGSGQGDLGGGGGGGGNTVPALNNNSIVFVSTRDGNDEIYSMDVTKPNSAKRLTDNAADDVQPSRSRDGRRVVFSSLRDGNAEIYVMNADGSGTPLRLTADVGPANAAPIDQKPVFSPDDTKIVWQSNRDGINRLWTMDADGNNQRPFGSVTQGSSDGSWNPDSKRALGFVPGSNNARDLALISRAATTGNPDTFQVLRANLNGFGPRYSPDGSRIVYSTGADLQFLDGSGAPVAGAPTGGSNQSNPSYSPEGNRLAWDANTSTNVSAPNRQIYLATPGSGTTPAAGTIITSQGENFDPSWTQ